MILRGNVVQIGRPTPAKRKNLSKRTRFEVFKRDSFTCQYCGRTPPDALLVVDHLVAVANGGTDDILNLITSCETCNQGKSDKPVTQVLSPDAVGENLRVQQEIAEAKQYLNSAIELQRLRMAMMTFLQDEWDTIFSKQCRAGLSEKQIKIWLANYSPEEMVAAWEIVGGYMENGKDFKNYGELFRYISGVLKHSKNNTYPPPKPAETTETDG